MNIYCLETTLIQMEYPFNYTFMVNNYFEKLVLNKLFDFH